MLAPRSLPAGRVPHAPLRHAFPLLAARTLAGRALDLPTSLAGQPALLVVGFGPAAASDAEAWLRWAAGQWAAAGDVAVYLLVVVEGPRLLAPLVEGAMRAASASELQPYAAIAYDPTRRVRAGLGPAADGHARAYLLDADGWIAWQGSTGFGAVAAAEAGAIARALAEEARLPAR